MQMSPLDYEQGVELLRLICDLEHSQRDDVILMITHRYDMKHDDKLLSLVGKRFKNVIPYITKKQGTGWPAGPNAMMADSYIAAINLDRCGTPIDAVMFMECDCVPLDRDWIDEIKLEWSKCRAIDKSVLGPWNEVKDTGIRHINGNCLISIDYWKKNRGIFNCPDNVGWDVYHALSLCNEAMPSETIFSDYKLGTESNPWKGDDYLWEPKSYKSDDNPLYGKKLYPSWFHGIKTMQGINAVRKKLLT